MAAVYGIGIPMSKQLEAKRLLAARKKQQAQAALDSIDTAEKQAQIIHSLIADVEQWQTSPGGLYSYPDAIYDPDFQRDIMASLPDIAGALDALASLQDVISHDCTGHDCRPVFTHYADFCGIRAQVDNATDDYENTVYELEQIASDIQKRITDATAVAAQLEA